MSSDPQQVRKLEAVKRSLAIANRVTSAAIVEARKSGKKKRCASPSMSGGKRKRSASPGGKRKKSPAKRKKSPAKRK